MKKIRCLLCMVLILTIALSVVCIYGDLPLNTQKMVAEKYNSWTGVIRIWLCEGWTPGISGAAVWLNKCAASFEKAHEGVYIQIQHTDAAALQDMCENGIIPPDMIVFPPGILKYPAHLIPLSGNIFVRPDLSHSGMYNGIVYALPILMGGYIWAYNSEMIDSIPDTWEDSEVPLIVPPDEKHRCYSAALVALCSGRFIQNTDARPSDTTRRELDIGLPIEDAAQPPTRTPVPDNADFDYCRLPDDVSFSEDAFSDFVSGNICAVPVTQKEIQSLKSLSEKGKSPEWHLQLTGEFAYSDQLLFASVVDGSGNYEKQKVCFEFLKHILRDECQKMTGSIGAFSVTDTFSGYSANDPFIVLEDMLRTRPAYAENAFSGQGNDFFINIVRDFFACGGFSPALHHRMMDVWH